MLTPPPALRDLLRSLLPGLSRPRSPYGRSFLRSSDRGFASRNPLLYCRPRDSRCKASLQTIAPPFFCSTYSADSYHLFRAMCGRIPPFIRTLMLVIRTAPPYPSPPFSRIIHYCMYGQQWRSSTPPFSQAFRNRTVSTSTCVTPLALASGYSFEGKLFSVIHDMFTVQPERRALSFVRY